MEGKQQKLLQALADAGIAPPPSEEGTSDGNDDSEESEESGDSSFSCGTKEEVQDNTKQQDAHIEVGGSGVGANVQHDASMLASFYENKTKTMPLPSNLANECTEEAEIHDLVESADSGGLCVSAFLDHYDATQNHTGSSLLLFVQLEDFLFH